MTQNTSADVANLFRKFSGDPGGYQEIKKASVVEAAQQSWPIVEALKKERITPPSSKLVAPSPRQVETHAPEKAATEQTLRQPLKHTILPTNAPSLAATSTQQNQSARVAPVAAQAAVPRETCAVVAPPIATFLFGNQLPADVSRSTDRQFCGTQSESASDDLKSVFARLERTVRPAVESPSSSGLRGMLKFLAKP